MLKLYGLGFDCMYVFVCCVNVFVFVLVCIPSVPVRVRLCVCLCGLIFSVVFVRGCRASFLAQFPSLAPPPTFVSRLSLHLLPPSNRSCNERAKACGFF